MSTGKQAPRLPRVRRLSHLVRVLAGFYARRIGRAILSLLPGTSRRLAEVPSPERRFRALLEELGGTFIKLGQVLSLQPDLVPSSYCDELFDLLDRVPPFAYQDVERTFVEDLGRKPPEVFDRFDRVPFASASIGQVHRAALDGCELAVKVRRPTALRDFGGDIGLMKAMLWLISKLRLKKLDSLRLPLSEFIAWTGDELDYRREARYMEQVRVNTGTRPEARVPAVIQEISTARILAAEYLEGTTLLEYLRSLECGDPAVEYRLREIGFDAEKFADNILANFLGDVFRHGIFHADLHPANLLILPDNVVGYVDFGITGVISEYGGRHVLAMILALARHDVDELLEGIFRISEVTDDSDVEGFRNALREHAELWFGRSRAGDSRGGSELAIGYTRIMLDMIQLSRRFAVFPHEEAMRYMRSVITADGLIARFAPGFDVNRSLERLSRRHLESRTLASAFSADRMIDSWIVGSRLMRDGALRLDRLLDKLEKEGPIDSSSERPRSRSASSPARALRLGVSVLALTAMMILADEPVRSGLNLFLAEAVLIGVGTLMLTWTVFRWMLSNR
ncbi:MAG: AarF/ABC1/UbiB kinase family protein [bacterium]|nr:AarF/ABC1/UbiB kinase family protein [bacterium]